MDLLKGLLNWTSLLPMFIASIILFRAAWLTDAGGVKWGATKNRMHIDERIAHLNLLRRFIPLLPLAGILGTVVALVKTLLFMAEQSRKMNIADALPDVLAKFAPALFSTAVGVVGAGVCIVVIELSLHRLGADETD